MVFARCQAVALLFHFIRADLIRWQIGYLFLNFVLMTRIQERGFRAEWRANDIFGYLCNYEKTRDTYINLTTSALGYLRCLREILGILLKNI